MGERDHYLHGAEDVRSAANTMSNAADRMRDAANSFIDAADKIATKNWEHEVAMGQWLERFEAAVEKMHAPDLRCAACKSED